MRQFCVIGLGNFGAKVAIELAKLRCEVTAIDIDKEKVQALEEHSRLTPILADASDRKVLEHLGVKDFDGFIVSTGKDSHAAILVALHLKEMEAKQIIVKANSTDHAKILKKVGATDALIPEELMAYRLAHSLARTNLIDYLPLTEDYHIAELVTPDSFVDRTLEDLRLRSAHRVLVIAVKDHAGDRVELGPDGSYKIRRGDVLVLLGKEEDIGKLKS